MTQHHEQPDTPTALRRWLRGEMDSRRLSVAEVARISRISRGTVYRILDPESPFKPRLDTIEKLEAALAPAAGRNNNGHHDAHLHEDELIPVSDSADAAPAAARADDPVCYRVNTQALMLRGYLPGDVVRLDTAGDPRAGDVVAARVHDVDRGASRLVLRAYHPPYLLAYTAGPDANPLHQPLYVDGRAVRITAVMVSMTRRPRG